MERGCTCSEPELCDVENRLIDGKHRLVAVCECDKVYAVVE